MSARVIPAADLFRQNRNLLSGNHYAASLARQCLKNMAATEDTDMTVANVASRLARPLTVYAPPTSGDAA